MKNVMVTLLLFREKDAEPKQEAQHAKQPITESVDGPTKEAKQKTVKDSVVAVRKQKKIGNLRQFYIGQFELRVNGEEENRLTKITDKLIELGEPDFKTTTKFLVRNNLVFAHLMDSVGDSYLTALYIMNIFASDTPGNREFIPKKARNKDTEKIEIGRAHV